MPPETLDFEEPVALLLKEIEALKLMPPTKDRLASIGRLEARVEELRTEIFAGLGPWQCVQVARHPNRPCSLDYVERLFTEFTEVHGDRRFADDKAIIAGFAFFHGRPVVVVGHQKGRDTKQKIFRNFGYAKPEGYRKALRVMKLAEKFGRPVVAFVDTPAAYPGIESEERGVAEAIALNLREMSQLNVPIVVIVCGEGGSGGALGIAVGDRVLMQEFGVYSVIPPEGCAAILWRDAQRKVEAAEALKITAPDLLALGIDRRDRQRARWRRAPGLRRGHGASRRSPDAPSRATGSDGSARAPGCPLQEVPCDGPHRAVIHRRRDSAGSGKCGGADRLMLRRVWEDVPADERRVSETAAALAVPPVIARLLVQRGFDDLERAQGFLHPQISHLHDPFLLKDMRAGCRSHHRRGQTRRIDRHSRRL